MLTWGLRLLRGGLQIHQTRDVLDRLHHDAARGLFTDLVKRIQEAETVKIEVRAHNEGRTIFTFNVAGFDKDRYEEK